MASWRLQCELKEAVIQIETTHPSPRSFPLPDRCHLHSAQAKHEPRPLFRK
jgi:hypothetical protein